MTDDDASFVDEMGGYLASFGLPPMAGRMWGWLLICEPPEQTAAQLAEELHASRGAVSGTARMLQTAGFIRRGRRRGDRREYFSAPAGAFRALVVGAAANYRRFREITEHGLGVITDLPPPSRRRLEEVHEFVSFVEREFPILLERFVQEQAEAAAQQGQAATPADRPDAIPA